MFTINMIVRLACPECKSFPLELKSFLTEKDKIIKGEIVCFCCCRKYPVNEGIPNLLPEKLRLQKNREENSWQDWRKRLGLFKKRMKGWTEEDSRRIIPAYEELFHRFCPIKGLVLEIGCGNGVVRHFLNRDVEYWGIDPDRNWILNPYHPFAKDIFPCLKEPFPFIQGVGEYLPFKDESFDNVIITATLDHVNSPSQVFEESYRILKDKGQMLLSVSGGEHEAVKEAASSYLKRGVSRLLRGELIGLTKSVFRKLFVPIGHDLYFSMDEITHLFHKFSDLEIKPYLDLIFFKAKKK
jgi:SAM-dependent methyltransferase